MRGSEADRLANELTSAAAAGDTARAKLLLQNGADVNHANRFGRTPVQVTLLYHTHLSVCFTCSTHYTKIITLYIFMNFIDYCFIIFIIIIVVVVIIVYVL